MTGFPPENPPRLGETPTETNYNGNSLEINLPALPVIRRVSPREQLFKQGTGRAVELEAVVEPCRQEFRSCSNFVDALVLVGRLLGSRCGEVRALV